MKIFTQELYNQQSHYLWEINTKTNYEIKYLHALSDLLYYLRWNIISPDMSAFFRNRLDIAYERRKSNENNNL